MKGKLFLKSVLLVSAFVSILVVSAACSPQPATSTAGTDDSAASSAEGAVAVEWSPEADCATCHAIEEASRTDSSCVASLHAATNCIDCHADVEGLAKQHEGATSADKMPKKLKRTAVDQDKCLTCHGSYEELAEKTASYQGLADEHGTVANPHALPENDDHAEIVCGDCHKMRAGDSDAGQDATNTCLSCHHEGVFECGTCHSV